MIRKSGKPAAFTLEHNIAKKEFRGGVCKHTRPNSTYRRFKATTRQVGPKKVAREKEVLTWSSLVVTNAASQKVKLRARTNLEQHSLRAMCQNVDSMATLLLFTLCAGEVKAWPNPAQ